jgi:hypothetical protein
MDNATEREFRELQACVNEEPEGEDLVATRQALVAKGLVAWSGEYRRGSAAVEADRQGPALRNWLQQREGGGTGFWHPSRAR